MSKIFFHNESKDLHPLKGKILKYKQWLLEISENEEGHIHEINYIFCDDDYILKINKDFLNHDYYTDIITFPYSSEKNNLTADIFISLEMVRSNAEEFQQPYLQELHRVMAHGLLHLLGYNDKSNDQTQLMREKEEFYMKQISE